jgi:cellulose biosynthesis protein BcsQ
MVGRDLALADSESKIGARHKADDKMANDVARLYSWANVDDAPYRDFFRLRIKPDKPMVPTEAPRAGRGSGETAEVAETRFVEQEPAEPTPPPVVQPISTQPQVSYETDVVEPRRPAFQPPSQPVIETPLATRTGDAQNAYTERGTRLATESREFHPAMAIYSLAGGVGKTTLAANLGRALYSIGDRVLLVDASGSALLPFYFGANNLRTGLHTFTDPEFDRAPLRVVSADEVTPEWLEDDIRKEMDAAYWTIFDLGPASTGMLPQILEMCAFVLVPLLPDMNSILSVSRIESIFESMRLRGAIVPSPFYLFNKFDPEDPVDAGAQELVLRQCGGRLLPWSIRYDAEAARAIASRKTVIDHAPGAELAKASLNLAALLQRTVAGNRVRRSGRRWSDV